MWTLPGEAGGENLIRARAAGSSWATLHRRWILLATILASSMAFIDGTVVNVALPALQTHLNATALDVQWVVESYSLFLSALLLVGGSLGDQYGRRRIFLVGVSVFAIASMICGLATTVQQLIAARAVQGIGAALLVPGSLAIIGSSFPEEDRGRAIGTWSAFSATTAAVGPVLGGWLIQYFSWRAVFFINAPIASAVVFVSMRHISETGGSERSRPDWLGAVLAAAGLGALVYGLIESTSTGFGSGALGAVLLLAVILLGLFVLVEKRVANPMVPLGLFRSPTFAGANLLTLLLYGALGGTLFFLPLNLIQVQHYSPMAAGAALLPFIVLISLLSRWSGSLVISYGARLPLVVGPVIAAGGYGLFALPGAGGSYWTTFFPAIVVLGLGMAITVAPLTTTVMTSVDERRAGIASGVNNAVARTAGLIAIAALGLVMLFVFDRVLQVRLVQQEFPTALIQCLREQRTRLAAAALPSNYDSSTRERAARAVAESFVVGFRTIMLIGSTLAAASALVGQLMIPRAVRPPSG